MRILKQQDGIALVTSLVLTLISLAMVMVLMSFVLQSIKVSGVTKRYANSMEASYGGAELITKEIIPAFFNFATTSQDVINSMQATYADINLTFKPDNTANADACLREKLNNITKFWAAGTCGAQMTNPDPKVLPDLQLNLRSTIIGFRPVPGYNVYAKIIDTAVAGNTYKSRSDFDTKNPGGERDGSSPAAVPSLYTIEITGEPENSPVNVPTERVRLEVLYSY